MAHLIVVVKTSAYFDIGINIDPYLSPLTTNRFNNGKKKKGFDNASCQSLNCLLAGRSDITKDLEASLASLESDDYQYHCLYH